MCIGQPVLSVVHIYVRLVRLGTSYGLHGRSQFSLQSNLVPLKLWRFLEASSVAMTDSVMVWTVAVAVATTMVGVGAENVTVVWASHPVRHNETVVTQVYGVTVNTEVVVSQWDEASLGWRRALTTKPINASSSGAALVLPPSTPQWQHTACVGPIRTPTSAQRSVNSVL